MCIGHAWLTRGWMRAKFTYTRFLNVFSRDVGSKSLLPSRQAWLNQNLCVVNFVQWSLFNWQNTKLNTSMAPKMIHRMSNPIVKRLTLTHVLAQESSLNYPPPFWNRKLICFDNFWRCIGYAPSETPWLSRTGNDKVLLSYLYVVCLTQVGNS